MHPSFLGRVFKLGRRSSDVLGVSEAIGTVLLLGISVTLAGAIALWTQTIDEGEQGIYVDLWANIQGNSLILTHRGGDFLDGSNTYIHVRNSDGTTATRNYYTALSGTSDPSWGPGEELTFDLTAVSDSFDVIVTTIKGNGNPTVIMSSTMLKSGVGGALPDLAVTMIQLRDTNGFVISSGIYEEGPYQIFINVSNFGSDLPAPYFIDEHVTHTVSNLQIFHTADDLQISSVAMRHMRPGTPPTEIVGADRGKLENGDYIEVVYMWNAFQSDPRTLGTHSLNVKVMPHPDGEINYRNNYVDRKVKVNKEITPMIIDGPDPGIYSISFSEGSPQSGDTVTVTVIIQNSGDQAITAAHNVHMVVSTWAPQRMEGTNYDNGFTYTGQYYLKESFDWKMDSPPGHHGDWRSEIPDGSQPMVYDDVFPTCVVPNIELLPGAYFFYYFNLEARVDVPGGEQRVYVAIDVFDHLLRPQGIAAMQGDDTKDNQGIGTIQVLPRILLVDDDEAQIGTTGDMTSSVIEALVGSGVTVDKVYVAQEVEDSGNTRDAPAYDYVQAEIPAPAMQDYDIVIWVTGYVDNPFTNKPAPALHGGNIQEMMKYMDSNKYLLIVGESPLKGLTDMFAGNNNPLLPQAPYVAGQPVFEDGKDFVYNYLGISWIENEMDLPLAGDVIRGLDIGPSGITPIPPSKTQYDIELKDLSAGNEGMQLFKLRDADVLGFEKPIGVTTTEDEITAASGKFNMLRITSTPSGLNNAQYRTAVAAWDINQIEFLNEKINLFSGVLKWFDWKINVGRDLAVTRMQLFILTESTPGVWTQELISPTNLPKYLDTVYIEASVRNNGPSVESTSLIFYVTGPDGVELPIAANQFDPRTTPAQRETFGNPQDISSIAGGGEEVVRYKLWLAVGVGQYTFRVVVDPYHLITEVSEENNDITYSTSTVTSFVTQNNILIVDDDFSDNNFDDHADTIANKAPLTINYAAQGGSPTDKLHLTLLDLGYDHEVHIVKNSNATGAWVFDSGLGILDIKRYNSIIWVFGDSGDRGLTQRETLTNKDLDAMMTYLDGKYNEAVFLPATHTENIAFIGVNFLQDLHNHRAEFIAPSITVTVEQFANDFLGIDVSSASAVRTGIGAGGVPDGDFINDIYTGIEYLSPLHLTPFLFRELDIIPVAESDQRVSFGSVEDITNDIYLTGTQLYRQALGKYSKTLVHSWQLNMLSDVDVVPATTDVESPLHEMIYLTLHWFNTPESRPELLSRNSKIKFDNDNPVLGNSYLVEIQIANVGGVAGGGTVRFTDGSTLIKSENIYMDADTVTTLEAIWTPLYAGMRTLMIWIDRYDNYDEVFDVINNKPYQSREIYFFWDDMEGGLGNWNHDATVQMINGEGKLDFLEEPITSNIVNEWESMTGFHKNKEVENPILHGEFRSAPNSYFMHEPNVVEVPYRMPLDMVIVIDTTGSMSTGTRMADAREAAKEMVDMFTEEDRCALFRLSHLYATITPPFLIRHFTYMTDANKTAFKSTIDTWTANGGTPLWDATGSAITYALDPGAGNRRPVDEVEGTDYLAAVMVMTDGDDQHYTNTWEAGSSTYAPGSLPGGHLSTSTWGVVGGNVWGQQFNYNNQGGTNRDVQRYYPYSPYDVRWMDLRRHCTAQGWSGTASSGGTDSSNRRGLMDAPLLLYTVGLGIGPQSTRDTAPNYMDPLDPRYPFTSEYALIEIAESTDGFYLYAPDSDELEEIFQKIFKDIEDKAQSVTRGGNTRDFTNDPYNPWSDNTTEASNKWMDTKPIDLRYANKALLSFYHKYNLKVGSNGGVIQIGIANNNANPDGDYTYYYIQPNQPYTGNTLTQYWNTNLDDLGVPMRWCWNGKSGGGTLNWDYVSVDLSKYSGHYIKIRFLFIHNYGGTGYGWIIDDVMIRVTSSVGNPDKDNTQDNWDIATTKDKNDRDTKAWFCGDKSLDGDLKNGIDNSLYTRPIDLTNARYAFLYAEFKFNIQTASGRPPDGFRVEISKDNGVSWAALNLGVRTAWGVSGTEDDASDGVPGDNKSFTGLPLGNYWVTSHSLARLITNLDGFIGNTVILRFRVVTNIDGQHYQDPGLFKGIYMDNIIIFGESLDGSRNMEMEDEIIPIQTPQETIPSVPEVQEVNSPSTIEIPEGASITSLRYPGNAGMRYAIAMILLLMIPALIAGCVIRRKH